MSGSSSSRSLRYWLQLGSPLTVGADGIGRPVWGLTHQHSPLWPCTDILHWNNKKTVPCIYVVGCLWKIKTVPSLMVWRKQNDKFQCSHDLTCLLLPVLGYTAPSCHSLGCARRTGLPGGLCYLWRASWISSPGSGRVPADKGSWGKKAKTTALVTARMETLWCFSHPFHVNGWRNDPWCPDMSVFTALAVMWKAHTHTLTVNYLCLKS